MKRKLFSLLAIAMLGIVITSASAKAAPVDGSEAVIGEQKAKPAPTPTPKPRKPGPRDEGDGE